MAPATSRNCEIVELPGELSIRVRWIKKAKGMLLLGIMLPVFAVMIWTEDDKLPVSLFVLTLLYPVLLFGFNWHNIRVTPTELRKWHGPLPTYIGSWTMPISEIGEVACRIRRTPSGRVGYVERYTVRILRQAGGGSIDLLDSGREDDARAAGLALVAWLNTHRGPGLPPLELR